MSVYERRKQFIKSYPRWDGGFHSSACLFFSSSSTRFLNSSMGLLEDPSNGFFRESRNADIQREPPPLVAPRAMAYITKLEPIISRINNNAAIRTRSDSKFTHLPIVWAGDSNP